MGKTHRNTPTERCESPLPPRVTDEPDFAARTFGLMEPDLNVTFYRTPLLPGPTARAYETIDRFSQRGCGHIAELQPDRFGDAFCPTCGAQLWSPWWVAAGVFGDETRQWINVTEHQHQRRMAMHHV